MLTIHGRWMTTCDKEHHTLLLSTGRGLCGKVGLEIGRTEHDP